MTRGYRNSITIQRNQSPDGVLKPDFQDFLPGIPCEIIPKSSYETTRGRQLEAGVTHVIEGHWIDGVKADDRAVNDVTTAVYDIKGVINVDEFDRKMRILANEITVGNV